MPSSHEPPKPPPEFFIDRSLGAILVPNAMRALGYTVHTMRSIYGVGAEETVEDELWIREGSEKGWVLLTKDRRIRHVSLERQAIEDSKARVFCLGPRRLGGSDQALCYTNNITRIVRAAQRDGPYIYKVWEDRIALWWKLP